MVVVAVVVFVVVPRGCLPLTFKGPKLYNKLYHFVDECFGPPSGKFGSKGGKDSKGDGKRREGRKNGETRDTMG